MGIGVTVADDLPGRVGLRLGSLLKLFGFRLDLFGGLLLGLLLGLRLGFPLLGVPVLRGFFLLRVFPPSGEKAEQGLDGSDDDDAQHERQYDENGKSQKHISVRLVFEAHES